MIHVLSVLVLLLSAFREVLNFFTGTHTCIFGPFKDGGDLVALRCVTLAPYSRRSHAHSALVGLHSTQVCCGRASTVWHLSVCVVGLQRETGCEMFVK